MAPKDEEKTKTGSKLSLESAEAQLDEMLKYYRIERESIVNEYGKDGVETVCNKLILAIKDGLLEIAVVDGDLKVTQNLQHAPGDDPTIMYGVLTGAIKITLDKYGEGKSYARLHALMGALAGLPPKAMEALKGADYGTMESLSLLFMLV